MLQPAFALYRHIGYQRQRADISTNCNFNFDLYIELDQASRDRLRISLNSFGPLVSLCLRSWRSSSVDDGSIRRSISRVANSDAFVALFARDPLRCVVSSPSSTSRRMASGLVGLSLCLAAQASTRLRSSNERWMVVEASCLSVRRPLFVRPPCASLSFHLHDLSTEQPSSITRTEDGGNSRTSRGGMPHELD